MAEAEAEAPGKRPRDGQEESPAPAAGSQRRAKKARKGKGAEEKDELSLCCDGFLDLGDEESEPEGEGEASDGEEDELEEGEEGGEEDGEEGEEESAEDSSEEEGEEEEAFDPSAWRRQREGMITVGGDAATAVVIWMHGLGDTPHGWAQLARSLQKRLQHTRWLLPCAPQRRVTCNGGMVMTSWLDLLDIPITPKTGDNGRDLPESVAAIHELIDKQVAAGVPANRVVLGGFSQGAALALVAALRYPQALAGACVLSGWAPPKADVPALAKAAGGRCPFLVCHGSADGTVLPACGSAARAALEAAGAAVEFHSYPGLGHGSCGEEEAHVAAFLRRVLP